jgi:hypothetical protein
MFKNFNLKVDAETVTVNHEINVSKNTHFYAKNVIAQIGTTTIGVIACAALAKTSSEILIHIAKTTIK